MPSGTHAEWTVVIYCHCVNKATLVCVDRGLCVDSCVHVCLTVSLSLCLCPMHDQSPLALVFVLSSASGQCSSN